MEDVTPAVGDTAYANVKALREEKRMLLMKLAEQGKANIPDTNNDNSKTLLIISNKPT